MPSFFFFWAFKQLYFPTKVWGVIANINNKWKNYITPSNSTSEGACSGAVIGVCREGVPVEISTCKVCTSSLISSPEPQNSATSMANTGFKGRYLHEGVSNLRSSKELTCQFVSVLSNGEGLSAIWASLNFWLHYEISCALRHMRVRVPSIFYVLCHNCCFT